MSEPVTSTRCLFCSLMCPLALARDPSGSTEEMTADYIAADPVTEGRLCFRGHMIPEMATHPLRLTNAELRAPGQTQHKTPVSVHEALEAAASRLMEAGERAAVLVDGNLPTEDIASAMQLARDALKTTRVAVYLPDTDAAMCRGMNPETPFVAAAEIAGSDVVFIIGDAFTTHPVISKALLEARAARKLRIVACDCIPNHVAPFAEKFVLTKPDGAAALLAAVCKQLGCEPGGDWAAGRSAAELAEMAGASEADVKALADAISGAKSPAMILAPVPGRMSNVSAAAAAASSLCIAKGGRLMPLFRYGNAVGAVAAMGTSQPWQDCIQAVRDRKVDTLLTLGVDVLRLVPTKEIASLRRRLQTLIVASPMRDRSAAYADILLPMAATFETGGTVQAADGNCVEIGAAMSPPGGALPVRDLCAGLASAMGRHLSAESQAENAAPCQGQPDAPEEPVAFPETGLQLIARSNVPDFDTGTLSRLMAWPAFAEPMPELHMNASDVKKRGLAPRGRAVLRANGHEAFVRLRVDADVPEGMAAVSTAFEETRPLFRERRVDGVGVELCWSEADVMAETDT